MKILKREQIQAADAYTIVNEPIKSIDLMERASTAFYKKFLSTFKIINHVHIFCGKGNNGGDGLVVARLLLNDGFDVTTYIVNYSENASPDFLTNLSRLSQISDSTIFDINDEDDFPPGENGVPGRINDKDIIVDALWGTGLTRPIKGFAYQIIKKINETKAIKVGLDIPSGTFCDSFNDDTGKIKANYTFSFQPPKLSFMIPENEPFIGNWAFLDIGLDKAFIDSQPSAYTYFYEEEGIHLFKKRNSFDHKGKFGHALIFSGSYGKMGAAILASKACIRTGAGLVSAYVPKCGYEIMQSAVPELMVQTDEEDKLLTSIPNIERYTTIGLGPGIGTHKRTDYALARLFNSFKKTIVLDADAINIISRNRELLKIIPKNSILTPHIGEFNRLVGESKNHFERLEKLQEFSIEHQLIVVLKGKNSAICNVNGQVFFNSTGNPGMATAGSGDVLTGIITGLLSQNYEPIDASVFGTFLHGLAGDLAAEKLGYNALTASDIIEYLPRAFKYIAKKRGL